MTDEKWEHIFRMVKDHRDSIGYSPQAETLVAYLRDEPVKAMTMAVEDAFRFFGERPYNLDDEAEENVLIALGWVLNKLPRERQFLLVKIGLRHLAEDLDWSRSVLRDDGLPIPKWERLWALFTANNSQIVNAVQKRQLRSLATKLVATHPFYAKYYFIIDQLILIPKTMRMSRLERKKWFYEKRPNWFVCE